MTTTPGAAARLLAALAGLSLLLGCARSDPSAVDESPDAAGPAPGDVLALADGEPVVDCGDGDGGWPAAVMRDGIASPFRDEARAVFAELLADPFFDEEPGLLPGGVDAEFRVLRDNGHEVVLGVGRWTDRGPRGDASVLTLARRADRWRFAGGGGCSLEPVLQPGLGWAELDGATPAPDGHTVEVGVVERACTSGRDPEPYLREPVVLETATDVVVYWTAEPARGAANCMGNPSSRQQLELQEPLGDRDLLDGSTYPPRAVPLER